MNEVKINIQKTASVIIHGNPKTAKHTIVALHGYGQLARFFAKVFECLDEQEFAVIIPEGMHRFYLQGFNGRVGASWMTKENRLDDIQNNIDYLNQIVDFYQLKLPIVIGFSQGAATAVRWICQTKFPMKSLVLWGAVFPEDISFESALNKPQNVYMLIGNQDEFFVNFGMENYLKEHKNLPFEYNFISYEGGHKIDEYNLKFILDKIIRSSSKTYNLN